MKKQIIPWLMGILLTFSYQSVSQSLGQDTEGFSTLVFPSTNIGLNLSEDVASFSLYRKSRFTNNKPSTMPRISDAFRGSNDPSIIKNNLEKILKQKEAIRNKEKASKYVYYGVDLKGSSENGLAPIFSSEKLASSASINGLIGIKWMTHHHTKEHILDYVQARLNISEFLKIKKQVKKLLKNKVLTPTQQKHLITKLDNDSISVKEKIPKVIDNINELETLKSGYVPSMDAIINHLQQLATFTARLKRAIDRNEPDADIFSHKKSLSALMKKKDYKFLLKSIPFNNDNIFASEWDKVMHKIDHLILLKKDEKYHTKISFKPKQEIDLLITSFKKYQNGLDLLVKLDAESENDIINQLNYKNKYLVYVRGGFSGSEFKLDLQNNGTSIDSRFADTSFNGYNVELGTTMQFKKQKFLGASIAYSYTHNLGSLESRTFAFQTVDPNVQGGNLVNVEQINALTGGYDRFHRLDINLDYAYLFKLLEQRNPHKPSQTYLSINPYLRHRIYNNANTLKNNTVLGIGFHAYNSKDNKLMGGVYIQTRDLFGVHKNDKGFFDEGISFGLVVQYNFDGLKL
ncbi:hypothetical protein SAMN04489761_0567 [Tenacibaculum sp. MAR_2009_124]|uniref:hypothetical protein n=1 Tax=Tenacibaculum sp. MAR_2009_124 TaxID=1250059 RepID=UPI000897E547|nr:hypothetical protein [Tenacibaculum sp. MAR_2009_124]SEB41467.1 hypothetical protein SAMN04489761_0567 [Tenacibaculum sp. MAR_2009_124]